MATNTRPKRNSQTRQSEALGRLRTRRNRLTLKRKYQQDMSTSGSEDESDDSPSPSTVVHRGVSSDDNISSDINIVIEDSDEELLLDVSDNEARLLNQPLVLNSSNSDASLFELDPDVDVTDGSHNSSQDSSDISEDELEERWSIAEHLRHRSRERLRHEISDDADTDGDSDDFESPGQHCSKNSPRRRHHRSNLKSRHSRDGGVGNTESKSKPTPKKRCSKSSRSQPKCSQSNHPQSTQPDASHSQWTRPQPSHSESTRPRSTRSESSRTNPGRSKRKSQDRTDAVDNNGRKRVKLIPGSSGNSASKKHRWRLVSNHMTSPEDRHTRGYSDMSTMNGVISDSCSSSREQSPARSRTRHTRDYSDRTAINGVVSDSSTSSREQSPARSTSPGDLSEYTLAETPDRRASRDTRPSTGSVYDDSISDSLLNALCASDTILDASTANVSSNGRESITLYTPENVTSHDRSTHARGSDRVAERLMTSWTGRNRRAGVRSSRQRVSSTQSGDGVRSRRRERGSSTTHTAAAAAAVGDDGSMIFSPDTVSNHQVAEDEVLARRLQEEMDLEYARVLQVQPSPVHFPPSAHYNHEDEQSAGLVSPDMMQYVTESHARRTRAGQSRSSVNDPSPTQLASATITWFPAASHTTRYRSPRNTSGRQTSQQARAEASRLLQEVTGSLRHIHNPTRRGRGTAARGRSSRDASSRDYLNETQAGDYDYDNLWALAEVLGEAVSKGLTKHQIGLLPTKTFQGGGGGEDAGECHVCMSQYENGDKLRILTCFHEYHANCIDKWLKKNNTCPVCRVEVKLT